MDVLFIGEASPEQRALWHRDAQRAGCEAVHVPSVDEAPSHLVSPPRAIFVDHRQDIEGFVAWVRGEAHLFTVPVIAMVPAAAERRFHVTHEAGADDAIVFSDDGAITRRLANLADFDPARRPEIRRGRCVIASADERRRRVLGRIVRQAGFDVGFAHEAKDLAERAEGAELVVTDLHDAAWLDGSRPPTILLAPADDVPVLRHRYARCAVGRCNQPPDHLLFQANELLRPDVSNVRASKRILHSAICTFRPAGSLEPAVALTYNFSREGLYVRTLDPPTRGHSLWLELRPPYRREAVHLRGEVVWATGPTRPGGTTPPGFGLRILEDACPPGDLATFREAYEELREESAAPLSRVA